MRAAKDSDHFWASSGWGRADNGESEFLRLRNNPDFRFKSRISGLQLYRKPKMFNWLLMYVTIFVFNSEESKLTLSYSVKWSCWTFEETDRYSLAWNVCSPVMLEKSHWLSINVSIWRNKLWWRTSLAYRSYLNLTHSINNPLFEFSL